MVLAITSDTGGGGGSDWGVDGSSLVSHPDSLADDIRTIAPRRSYNGETRIRGMMYTYERPLKSYREGDDGGR